MDDMDVDHEDQPRVKRFKHQSYNEILKDVHPTAAHNQQRLDVELEENDSNFHQALDHWRQLNLAPSFISFAKKADPLSASMPLLLHNWKEITDLWIAAFEVADDEGLRALLDLLQKIAHDLRTTLSPIYSSLVTRLLALLPRAISPPALQALLDTLGALFKYLLIPSTSDELLKQTWTALRETLPKCLPEIQRATAEVWGNILRRFKTSMRDNAVTLLASELEGIEDASAWAIVSACKSVSQTLHTATGSILLAILRHHINAENSKPSFTLLRRMTTALIHHVKKAEQFAPVADLLIKEFIACPKSLVGMNEAELDKLRRWLEILAIPCAVRQGSRMSQSQLARIFTECSKIPIASSLQASLLRFTTSIFTASEMQLWLGPGYKFLQRTWAQCASPSTSSLEAGAKDGFSFALAFNTALAELNWGGWKLVALPQLLKVTSSQEMLDMDPARMARFLSEVRRCKKVNEKEADLVWRERVGAWVKARLEGWEGGDVAKETELDDLLTISAMFSSGVAQPIINIINRTIESPQDMENLSEGQSAWVVGACMRGLEKMDAEQWEDKVDLTGWTRKCMARWGGESEVLGGLYALAQASPAKKRTPVPLEEIYPHSQTSLLSHSRALRLNTLRLLSSSLVQSPPGISDVVKRCLQGEEVPLDVQGVRERVLRIGRLGPMLKDDDEFGADVSIRWLIAQLKVNLRPIWSPATGAISSLAERFGDLVWKLVFLEVTQINEGRDVGSGSSSDMDQDGVDELDDVWEEERSWRDPSAHKLREAIGKTLDDKYAQRELVKSRVPNERLDIRSYETQLLGALRECSHLAEKHNRELVPYFLSLAGPDVTTKIQRSSLSAWLTLFGKFTNPKALHSTDTLLSLWQSLLSHPDRALQQLALSCLLTYKSPHLLLHQDKLRGLLDETRWRDELTTLDFSSIDPPGRSAFVDVTIRLLFGIMLEKKGRSRGADRRAAVLSTLAGCTDDELHLLIDLMLQPLGSHHSARRDELFVIVDVDQNVSDKQQVGFLNLLGDVLKNLGSKLVAYWPALIGVTVDLIANAQRRIGGALQEIEDQDGGGEEDELDEESTSTSASRVVRSIRQLGLKRFADFFRQPVTIDFAPYVAPAFPAFITPRLASLDVESTQAPSALLELFFTWSCEEEFVQFLWKYDVAVLPNIYGCLVAPSVKPVVIMRVFDIVDRLTSYSTLNKSIRDEVVKPHVSLLLTHLGSLIQQTKGTAIGTPLAQRQIRILSDIAQYCTNSQQASALLTLILPLLKRPSKLVAEKVKADLLKTVADLIPQTHDLADRSSEIYELVYRLLSSLFATVRSRNARINLVMAFASLAVVDTELGSLSELLAALNAYSIKRMDEPNFEARLKAFIQLNDNAFHTLSWSDWLPLLHNMLHHIQDPDELTIRNNASLSMRHFVDIVVAQPGSKFEETFSTVLYPGIKNTLHTKHEMVRSEILGVLAYAVQKCDNIASLQEMKILLANGDEEVNFFNNVLHVQLHRRSRALRRFADYCDEGSIRSSTLEDIFVPLIGYYIVHPSTSDHHLVNDAILTLGRTAKHLNWRGYYNLVQKYLKLTRAKDESERVYVRTLVSLLDNFHFPMDDTAKDIPDVPPVDEVETGVDEPLDPAVEAPEPPTAQNELVRSATQTVRISDAVNTRLLPSLLNHLETHNAETDDNARIPISIGIVTVAKHLPAAQRETQITRLLTILSQILRSRSQETRDLVRDALCRIAVALGPSFLPLMFKELRAALLRGPHLHILAYVVHAIIVHVTSGDHASSFKTLDDCVNDVAFVSAEVIFGESGKDVQSEDFKTKMREVRTSASKGLDSFATISKFITSLKISSLFAPLRSIMHETESLKVMNLVEEVLKRTASGLNSNEHLVPAELLVLCNALISQNARFLKQTPAKRGRGPKGDAIVQVKRQQELRTDHFSNNSYRFVSFGLDLFQTALRRNRFDFHDTKILARLDAMVAPLGNALYSTNASVLIVASRCAASLAKCPLKSLDKSLPVYISQLLDILRQAGNTESELAQTALKSLATILRDGPAVQVKEKDLVFLLEVITPELEEPERQASAFSMLRAIVARKFVVPEIYDTMDKVSEIMVTSQSTQVQELCRGVLLQFLLDYPQGKGRLRKQMTFLAQNLSYVHEAGRKSVMELLGAVIAKFQDNLIREYGDLLFVALVMVVANDESSKCREMAAALIKTLFVRLDDEKRRILLSHLHSWASQGERPQLPRVSSQVYGFIVDILQVDASPYINNILDDLNAALDRSTQGMATSDNQDEEAMMEIELDWQGPYNALISLTKITRVFSEFTSDEDRIVWKHVVGHLLFPHAWVRLAACRLLGILFTSVSVQRPSQTLYTPTHPLSSHGIQEAAVKLTNQLKSEHLDESLALQIVKNLFYIGKCFYLEVGDQEGGSLPDEAEGGLEDVQEPDNNVKEKSLPWLFSNLSFQIRSAQIARRNRKSNQENWHHRPLSALRWFAAMVAHMDTAHLERFLMHILSPVYRLIEEDIIRDPHMDELKTLATELQDLVQSKVGTTKFSAVYNQIRQNVLAIRRDRKNEKAVREARDPEAAAKRRISRNVGKKESKKRKQKMLADMHGSLKRRRQD